MGRMILLALALVVLAGGLVVGFSTWTIGSIGDVTTHDTNSRKGGPQTVCVASIDYEVAGHGYRSRDQQSLRGIGRPLSDCAFAVGDAAIVFYTDQHPEMGTALTAGGNQIYLCLMMCGMPFLLLFRPRAHLQNRGL